MTTLREAAQQALGALEALDAPASGAIDHYELERRKEALRDALAEEALQVMADNASDLGLSYEPVQRPSADLIEAVDTLLNESLCDCPDRMKHGRGEHLSGCHLFDLNEARLRMTQRTEPVQEPVAWRYKFARGARWDFAESDPAEWRDLDVTAEPLYTRPAPQPVELTDEELVKCLGAITYEVPARLPPGWAKFARAVIAAYQAKQEGKV